MSVFDDRERAYETQFRNQQDLEFRITVRRDKMFGRWAAETAGLTGQAIEDFAHNVIDAEVEHHEVLHKVHRDLAALGKVIPENELAAKLNDFHELAREQVFKENGIIRST